MRSDLTGLPYDEVWAVDFEFISKPGNRPDPVCMVARELRTGRLLRLWRDELPSRPPFRVDDRTLFVAYSANAELGCFEVLGWPMPARVLDLYVEFRALTNGLTVPAGRGLLGALAWHGIPSITKDEKNTMRDLVLRGGPWSPPERQAVLAYCQGDVDVLGPLLQAMLPTVLGADPWKRLGQALLRGRYMAAVARMENVGVPLDVELLGRLRDRWSDIKLDLVKRMDVAYGVYDGTRFKADRFEAWLASRGIAWPRHDSGRLALDRDTFKEQGRLHPEVAPLRELRHALSELRLERIEVGADGRNRVPLMPFASRTSRNTPPATRFIFGPSVWLRGAIKPAEGRALAYLDYSQQEFTVAAALSGDAAMLEAARSADPYLMFAKQIGLVPPTATKASHRAERDACKILVLGTNYGMSADGLALRLERSRVEAVHLLDTLARAYPTFWQWADVQVDLAMAYGEVSTVFGWPLKATADAKPRTFRNFPVQATGAEMLRLACCLATEAGVQVCAPVHDALLVEVADHDLDSAIAQTRSAMVEASQVVLAGTEVGVDVKVIQYPDRYSDERGVAMWREVMDLL